MNTPGHELRKLLATSCVAMPGAFNAMTARLIEAAGFHAIYVSGAGLSNATAGVPDVGLLGLTEFARLVGYVCDAVGVPVVSDADTGFGGASNAARTVRELERAGLAGIHIEDQVFPKRCGHLAGKKIEPVDEMVAKISAAVEAKRNDDFLLIARTDARAVEGFDAAVDRAGAYLDAGADAIFPEAMKDHGEFEQFAKQLNRPDVPLLANMTEFGKGPLLDVDTLARLGYRMVIFPQTAFRLANKTMLDAMHHLHQQGTQAGLLEQMQTRQELYDLMKYDPAEDIWQPRTHKD